MNALPFARAGGGRRLLLLLLPGWVVFIAYLPSLLNGFVWDDTYFLSDLPYLRAPELWPRAILAPLFVSENYFRPLALLMFVGEGRLGNANPFVFHFSNVLFHAASTVMIGMLAGHLLGTRVQGAAKMWLAAAAALFFGLHPALVESVCWISDRFDLMMAFFLLLALCADIRVRGAAPRAAVTGLLFLLALLSKETAVMFLAVLPLWHLGRDAAGRDGMPGIGAALRQLFIARRLVIYAALLAALAIYLAIRHRALGMLYHSDAIMVGGSALQHALLIGKTLGWYLVLLVWPFGLTGPVHPGVTPLALTDPWGWLGLLVLVCLLAALRRLLRRAPAAAWLCAAAQAALGPVSNLVPLTIADNIVHDRYLMFPVAMVVLAAMAWLGRPRAAVLAASPAATPAGAVMCAAAAAWLIAALVTVQATVPHWESDLTLWSWAHDKEPSSKIALGNYMTALGNAGADREVIDLGKIMLARYPKNPGALHNVSLALMHLGRYREALAYSVRALENFEIADVKQRLDASEALNLKGYLHMQLGEWEDAERELRAAAAMTPYLTRPYFNLAMVQYHRGNIDAARRELATALRYDTPQMAAVHRRLAASRERQLGLAAESP